MGKKKSRYQHFIQTNPHQPAEFTYPPQQANLSFSQQQNNTTVNQAVIVSTSEAIADLQSINAFSDQDKEWVKSYIEKEQAHRHHLDDKKLTQEKDTNDNILKITGRTQILGIVIGGFVTITIILAAVFFVTRGWNIAAIVAFMGALLPFASVFSKHGKEEKSKDAKQENTKS